MGEIKSIKLEKKLKEFSKLLDSLPEIESKKKILWLEIYENAVFDRDLAHALHSTLHAVMGANANEVIEASSSLNKYMERMSKSNEQLIKLAELIASETSKDEQLDTEGMFEAIKGKS